jgi:protein arginine N-methyltransferase 3
MSTSVQDTHRVAEDSYSDSDSASDSLNIVNGNDEGWEDVEPEEESQPVVGLFSADVYSDVRTMLKDTKERYNFDLVKVQRELGV